MEFRDESQMPSSFLTQGAKLGMTTLLFSTAKQIRLKRGPNLETRESAHQAQVHVVAWCDISQEGAE